MASRSAFFILMITEKEKNQELNKRLENCYKKLAMAVIKRFEFWLNERVTVESEWEFRKDKEAFKNNYPKIYFDVIENPKLYYKIKKIYMENSSLKEFKDKRKKGLI